MFCVLLSQSLAVMACSRSASQEQPQFSSTPAVSKEEVSRVWRAGTYRGITVGKSTRAEMVRSFGKSKWSEVFDENKSKSETWYHYEGTWEFPGRLTIVVDNRTDIIRAVDMYPKGLSREAAIKHFGEDYIVTRYDFDLCLGDEETAPLFESLSGSVISIEYRQRGIAVAVDDDGKVDHITYVSGPIGAASSKCK